jgi:hypothetical protein
MKLQENSSSGSRMRTDRETDMTKLKGSSRYLCNAPNINISFKVLVCEESQRNYLCDSAQGVLSQNIITYVTQHRVY